MTDVLYHVTFTASIPSIRSRGLVPFRTSNWIKSGDRSRYGDGSIYAFTHRYDAIRWAGRMDWEFHRATGTGKIAIITMESGLTRWVSDDADPLSQAGAHGSWLKCTQRVGPEQIRIVEIVTGELIRELIQTEVDL